MHRKLNRRFKLNNSLVVRQRMLGVMSIGVLILVGCASSAQTAALATPTLTAEQQLGKQVFEQHCKNCHSTIPESIVVGPSLAGVAQRASSRVEGMDPRDYIEMSITQPGKFLVEGYPDLMPVTLADTLSEEEVEAVLTYLMTLEE
jgi:mono/diheme cytochrome c family protein